MSSRKYRIICGISYPLLFTNGNQPTHANTDMENPCSFYYDPAIRLNENDMKSFVGKPICVEHDIKACIGEVASVWKDSDDKMRITARIYTDTKKGEEYFDAINSGQLGSLSVGYGISVDENGKVLRKQFDEISVCQQPFFEGADIRVAASDKSNYLNLKSNLDKKILNFKIMADQQATIESTNKDAAELAKVHDEMLRKNEELAKELAAMKERDLKSQQIIKQAEEDNKKMTQRYIDEMKPELEEAMKTQALIQKETFGETAEVPADWTMVAKEAFTNPDMVQVAKTITASSKAFLKSREASMALQKQLLAKDEELKRVNENQAVAMTHVEASKRLHLATGQEPAAQPTMVKVEASGDSKIAHLFRRKAPSQDEIDLYRQNFKRDPPTAQEMVQITANAAGAGGDSLFEAPPTHILKASVPASAANSENGGRGLFNMLRKFSYKGMNPHPFKATSEVVLEQ